MCMYSQTKVELEVQLEIGFDRTEAIWPSQMAIIVEVVKSGFVMTMGCGTMVGSVNQLIDDGTVRWR